jgi:hypothetical protein
MPVDNLTNADLTRILGPVTISADPNGGAAGNLSMAGTLNAASGTITNNLTVSNLASLAQIGGGVLNGGAGGSAVSLAAGGTLTVGSGARVVRISVAAIAGALNVPTDSVDGRELTVINAGTAALTLVTNVAGGGFAIASGVSSRIMWDVASTLWFHSA